MLAAVEKFLVSLDPKLVAGVLTNAVTFLALKVGLDVTPVVAGYISVAVGAVVAFLVKNEGSLLRAGTHPVQAQLKAARSHKAKAKAKA